MCVLSLHCVCNLHWQYCSTVWRLLRHVCLVTRHTGGREFSLSLSLREASHLSLSLSLSLITHSLLLHGRKASLALLHYLLHVYIYIYMCIYIYISTYTIYCTRHWPGDPCVTHVDALESRILPHVLLHTDTSQHTARCTRHNTPHYALHICNTLHVLLHTHNITTHCTFDYIFATHCTCYYIYATHCTFY